MAVSMAAMMAPTAAPFFVAFGRDSRAPIAIAAVVLIYVVAWGVIAAAAGAVMDRTVGPRALSRHVRPRGAASGRVRGAGRVEPAAACALAC